MSPRFRLRQILPLAFFSALLLLALSFVAAAETTGEDFKAKAADHYEHTIDFMVTIALGAFAVLGYLIKDSVLPGWKSRGLQLLLAAAAMLAGAHSLFYGYTSYLNLISVTSNGTFSLTDNLAASCADQAYWLLLEGAAVFATLIVTLLLRKAAPHV